MQCRNETLTNASSKRYVFTKNVVQQITKKINKQISNIKAGGFSLKSKLFAK